MENEMNAWERLWNDTRPLIALVGILAAAFVLLQIGGPAATRTATAARQSAVLPQSAELGVVWGDMGKRLVEEGVIDERAFQELYAAREGLPAAEQQLLSGEDNGALVMTRENAGTILNLLWAFGLANKNPILEKGEMTDPAYGGAGGFASTGGWTLAHGDAMDHYSRHSFVVLTQEQQQLVERVSKNIYRPCCDNSTHFPDCNHGMAMLGLLELLASQGASENEMYKAALVANSYWFPDTYLTIAEYLRGKGIDRKDVPPQTILGREYSSASGFARIAAEVAEIQGGDGASCGV
ncbi:MAG: hypothetical protein AAB804_02950 [Patescibacteria group bacterium]